MGVDESHLLKNINCGLFLALWESKRKGRSRLFSTFGADNPNATYSGVSSRIVDPSVRFLRDIRCESDSVLSGVPREICKIRVA